jgi:murein DD-endopeptidase MepM/ murein hydrolase activator NlpD
VPTSTGHAGDAAAAYQLHALADDMSDNERYYTRDHADTTTQKFGYDISMRRLTADGKWSSLKDGIADHWDDPKNDSYVNYDQPFYAMRGGTVMGCWRNAPDNPRPKLPAEDSDKIAAADRKWLHQSFRDGLIPGGGNSLWIKHDDGTYALYAHAAPGSIPATLCPNAKTVFDAPPPDGAEALDGVVGPATQVPAALRKRVRAGDFLGRVGNSGNSTGPHTHIHVQKLNAAGKWEGTPIVFARGLWTSWKDGEAGLEEWASFSGKTMPKGDVLFWPPTRLSDEYARHGLPAADLQRTFSHLANSGFAAELLDCSGVGGKVYYNMVWRPATGPWRAHFGMTGDTIEGTFEDAKAEGLHPVYVDSCTSKEGPRYTAIFQQTGGLYRWRFGISADEHQAVFDQAWGDGLQPLNVSVISVNGQRRYTSLFRKVDYGSMILRSQLGESEYQQAVNENKAAGRTPVYVAVYMHNGKPNFAAIFAQNPGGEWRARHDLSGIAYQAEWDNVVKSGFRTRTLSGYDGRPTPAFAAVWRK